MTPSQVAEQHFSIDVILVGLVVFTSIPAKMIDITHIRRKWFD